MQKLISISPSKSTKFAVDASTTSSSCFRVGGRDLEIYFVFCERNSSKNTKMFCITKIIKISQQQFTCFTSEMGL